jgi:hypothetical protein
LIGPFSTLHDPQASGGPGWNCWHAEHIFPGSIETSAYASAVRTCTSTGERALVSVQDSILGPDFPQAVVPSKAAMPASALFLNSARRETNPSISILRGGAVS